VDAATVGVLGAIASAASGVLIALLRYRKSDRETVIKTQQQHMARLARERNEAVDERETAYKDIDQWRERYEVELNRRIERGAEAHTSRLLAVSLEGQVGRLTAQVAELTAENIRLKTPGATDE